MPVVIPEVAPYPPLVHMLTHRLWVNTRDVEKP